MTPEEGAKMIISGGMVSSSDNLREKYKKIETNLSSTH